MRIPVCCVLLAVLSSSIALAQPSDTDSAAKAVVDHGVQPLSSVTQAHQRSAPATALSLNQPNISAEIQSVVSAINVGVSEQVTADQVLLRLDCTDYALAQEQAKAGVAAAQAQLKLAQNQQRRSATLLSKKLTSQDNADTFKATAAARRAQLQQAKVTLRQADRNSQRCIIKAPFDGVITQRHVSEGQLASVGTPLLTMVDTKRLELSAQIKPEEVQQLQQAKQLLFKVQDKQYPVQLLHQGLSLNVQTGDQEARLVFSEQMPLPGSAGRLVWQDPRSFVPANLIVRRNGRFGVFLQRDNKAVFHPLPQAVPGRSAVLQLPADTAILTKNLNRLRDGDLLP